MKPFLPIRAWIPSMNYMDYEPVIQNGKCLDVEGGWDIHGIEEDAVLMCGLILPNQNNIKIYEDDVLESTFTDWDENNEEFKINVPAIVLFTNGGFYVNDSGRGRDELIDWDLGNYPFRVLGNIHQNPELKKLFPKKEFF